METLRLRRIQEPSRVERLLEACVSRLSLVPPDACQIRDPNGLPASLRAVLVRARKQGQVWACWANPSRLWFFTCDMSLDLSRERGSPVLRVSRYSEDGALDDSGTWLVDPRGQWTRCAD